jgi:hypothetical protein
MKFGRIRFLHKEMTAKIIPFTAIIMGEKNLENGSANID